MTARPSGPATESATSRLSRLLTMVPWLLNRQGIEIEEAAREFGVSPEQMEADLELLFVCGTPGHMPDDLAMSQRSEIGKQQHRVTAARHQIRTWMERDPPCPFSSCTLATLFDARSRRPGPCRRQTLNPADQALVRVWSNRSSPLFGRQQ